MYEEENHLWLLHEEWQYNICGLGHKLIFNRSWGETSTLYVDLKNVE